MSFRLPRALAGHFALALILVAATTTLSAQTTTTTLQTPRIALRAVTNGDVSTYKLPSTTQISGGLGTVGLGEPLYLEVQIDISIPAGQLGGVVWSISEAPSGSTAKLVASPLGASVPIAEPSDRLIYQVAGRQLFRPDVHGLYVINAAVTINGTTTQLAQSYIAGTYVGVAVCTTCHGGGLAEALVTPWSATEHASMFTNGINGVDGTGYSASCISCHTVGYDANSTVNDGGFSSIAAQLGWTFPKTLQPGNFQSMPVPLQNVSNIQCENCHGPGSEHANYGGDVIAVAIPSNSGACSQCHDEPTHHIKSATWAKSVHAVTTTDPAGNASCVGCHTGTGFIARMNGESPITETAYHAIDCYTCHEPHGVTQPTTASHLIRNMASVTLADGTQVTSSTVGEGILCMQCHQSRMNASAVDTTAGSAHFGPHEGPQADMLMGTNGYTYGKVIPSGAHQYVTTNACIDCHMQTVASTDPAFMNAGDHTFSTTYTPATGPAEDLVGACQACHGTQITSFNIPTFSFDGSGGFRVRRIRW